MATSRRKLSERPPEGGSDPARHVPGQLEAALVRAEMIEPDATISLDGLPEIRYMEALDDGRTLSISPLVETLLGYTQEEWMADPMIWTRLIHPDDRERVEQECWENNRNEQPFRTTYRMIARDGTLRWFRDEAEVVRGSGGQRLCWEGRMVDITSQMPPEA